MDIISTTPVYLTESYLNFAKWIGFTVQMYMCMGVCDLSMYTMFSSLLECVSEAFFNFILNETFLCVLLPELLLSPHP